MKKKENRQIVAEVLNFQVTTSILDHVSDLVWIKDNNGRYMAVSESFGNLFGLEKDAFIGKTADEFDFGSLEDVADDQTVIRDRKISVMQKTKVLSEGGRRFFEVHKAPICDIAGNVVGIIATGRDITELVQKQEHLRYIGYHDMLTKLHNRNYFEQLPEKLLKDNVEKLGMVICDIDGLKLVNDTLGHTAGDERLKVSAGILAQSVGSCGEVSRIGGDEFVVVVPDASQKIVDIIVHRMKVLLEEHNCSCEHFPLNISFGVAIGNLSTTDFFTIFRDADNSMYRDKMLHAESSQNVMVKTVIKMLSMKDFIMEGHAERLQGYVTALGQAAGLHASKLNDLRLLAEFHDIGKIGISEAILKKPGPLSADELVQMRRHPEIGYHFSKAIPNLSPISDWILKHHEWWDGSGYPLGIRGENIPIEARIIHIADAFDAMTHNRPYRKSLGQKSAILELKRGSGTQFDPDLVKKFLRLDEINTVQVTEQANFTKPIIHKMEKEVWMQQANKACATAGI